MANLNSDMTTTSTPFDVTPPTTPILIFTSDNDASSSIASTPSDSGENEKGWGSHHHRQEHPQQQGQATKDTSYATLYQGYGRPLQSNIDFDDLLLLRSSNNKGGAPTNPPATNVDSTNSHFGSVTNSTAKGDYTGASSNNNQSRRRHSSSSDNAIPYRQSSLKWKQRNGSATFELKITQGEFMRR